jgi:ribosome-associated protein
MRKEQAESKPPKSFRLLFQLIKQAIPEPGKPRQQADDAADDADGEDE